MALLYPITQTKYMNRACHFHMEALKKRIKSKRVTKNPFDQKKQRSKRLHDDVVSLRNEYIHTYINP